MDSVQQCQPAGLGFPNPASSAAPAGQVKGMAQRALMFHVLDTPSLAVFFQGSDTLKLALCMNACISVALSGASTDRLKQCVTMHARMMGAAGAGRWVQESQAQAGALGQGQAGDQAKPGEVQGGLGLEQFDDLTYAVLISLQDAGAPPHCLAAARRHMAQLREWFDPDRYEGGVPQLDDELLDSEEASSIDRVMRRHAGTRPGANTAPYAPAGGEHRHSLQQQQQQQRAGCPAPPPQQRRFSALGSLTAAARRRLSHAGALGHGGAAPATAPAALRPRAPQSSMAPAVATLLMHAGPVTTLHSGAAPVTAPSVFTGDRAAAAAAAPEALQTPTTERLSDSYSCPVNVQPASLELSRGEAPVSEQALEVCPQSMRSSSLLSCRATAQGRCYNADHVQADAATVDATVAQAVAPLPLGGRSDSCAFAITPVTAAAADSISMCPFMALGLHRGAVSSGTHPMGPIAASAFSAAAQVAPHPTITAHLAHHNQGSCRSNSMPAALAIVAAAASCSMASPPATAAGRSTRPSLQHSATHTTAAHLEALAAATSSLYTSDCGSGGAWALQPAPSGCTTQPDDSYALAQQSSGHYTASYSLHMQDTALLAAAAGGELSLQGRRQHRPHTTLCSLLSHECAAAAEAGVGEGGAGSEEQEERPQLQQLRQQQQKSPRDGSGRCRTLVISDLHLCALSLEGSGGMTLEQELHTSEAGVRPAPAALACTECDAAHGTLHDQVPNLPAGCRCTIM